MAKSTQTIEERFWAKVRKGDTVAECWAWLGHHSQNGYGRFKVGKTQSYAHRVAYTLTHGDVPEGCELDHLCRNRACCNPAHLEPVTRSENQLRGYRARFGPKRVTAPQRPNHRNNPATHCVNGHAFDAENTHFVVARNRRVCRACDRIRQRRKHDGQRVAMVVASD